MDIEKLAQSTFNKHRESVVIVDKKGTTPEEAMMGTGFIIRSTSTCCLVMTCYHVIKGFVPSRHKLCIRFAGDATEYGATVPYGHPPADLAIIRVHDTEREYPALHFGDAEGVPAETDVCLLGYIFTGLTVLALEPGVSPGKTSAPPQVDASGMKDVVFTSTGKDGFSGAPVMLGDKVIGVMYGGRVQVLHARSSETVNSVLKQWLRIAPDDTRSTVEMIDLLKIGRPRRPRHRDLLLASRASSSADARLSLRDPPPCSPPRLTASPPSSSFVTGPSGRMVASSSSASASTTADPSGLMVASSSSAAAAFTTAGPAEVNSRVAEAEAEQDSMESAYRSLLRDISPSVVLVQQVGRIEYFCVGSVIQSEDESTFIMTQSNILYSYSAARLMVLFSDGHQQPASLVSKNDLFCILRTSFHSNCKALELFEGEIDHTYAAAIAPASSCSVYNIPGFILQKSIQASDDVPGILLPEKHFFILACRYGDSCPNGKSRLISGPAFNMDSKTLGFVFEDCRYKHFLEVVNDQVIDPENYVEQGFHLKICLASSHLDEMLGSMVGDVDWRKALKSFGHKGE